MPDRPTNNGLRYFVPAGVVFVCVAIVIPFAVRAVGNAYVRLESQHDAVPQGAMVLAGFAWIASLAAASLLFAFGVLLIVVGSLRL